MVGIVGRLLGLSSFVLAGCTCSGSEPRPPPLAASSSEVTAGQTSAEVKATGAKPNHAEDSPTTQRLRRQLVRQIVTLDKPWGGAAGWDPQVLEVMRSVPRHLFVPGISAVRAYQDTPQPIGHDQTISQPTVVALMSQALLLEKQHRVLEIGTGSGYQAAVLSALVKQVYSIEIVPELGNSARDRLKDLGYSNVSVRVGDGYKGWPEHAPFDRVVLTAAPPEIPRALVEQLVDGGILVAPVGEHDQVLVRWTKRNQQLEKEELGRVRFVPMVPADP